MTSVETGPTGLMNTVRRWVDHSPLRRILLNPRVRRVGATLLMVRFVPAVRQVRSPVRFLLRDIWGRSVASYQLRGTDTTLMVDHVAGGLELVAEVFEQGCYEPPESLKPLVGDAPRILDLGANVGAFVALASIRWPESNVTAVEPDPRNASILKEMCRVNSLDVDIVEACAATHEVGLPFAAGGGAGSMVREGGALVRSIDVLPLMHDADLLKMDIEGSEWPILADKRMRDLKSLVLVMEFHKAGCPSPPSAAAARSLLERAGFEVDLVAENYWGHGLMWAHKTSAE